MVVNEYQSQKITKYPNKFKIFSNVNTESLTHLFGRGCLHPPEQFRSGREIGLHEVLEIAVIGADEDVPSLSRQKIEDPLAVNGPEEAAHEGGHVASSLKN